LLGVAFASLLLGSVGCAGPPPPSRKEAPPSDAATREPAPSLTGHLLVIEPVEDESASREVAPALMDDFRDEIYRALAGTSLFADVRTDAGAASGPVLLLRPIILLLRETSPTEQDLIVEMEARFELRVSSSRGLIWQAEYREESPKEILYQSPFQDRARLLAAQATRQRILAALRRDLTRFLGAY
jgi:hypothetical protein